MFLSKVGVLVKDKVSKIIKSKFFFLLIFFVLILFVHQFFEFSNDDISFFGKALNDYSLFEYIKLRYNTWTSRILIESVLINISRNIHLWRIANSLVICLLVYSIEKLFIGTGKIKNLFLVSLLFLLYPYYQMAEAGFAATTINYLWPLTFLLFSFLPLRDMYDQKDINKKMLPLYLMALIFACNQEQTVCVALIVSIISLIYCIKKNKNKLYSLLMMIIALFSLGFILSCPGNDIRNTIEITNCYPDYINADWLDKTYLGIVSTCSILISNFSIIWLFSFTILGAIILEKSKISIKLLGWLQFIIITIISIFRIYVIFKCDNILDAYTYGIFWYHTEVGNVFNFSLTNLLVLGLCLGMVLIYIILLCHLFKEKANFIILILLIGCGTRLIMGFSPTIFESGSRTTIVLYFSLLVIILFLWIKYKKICPKWIEKLFYILLIIFIIINYILTFLAIPLLINP